MRWKRYRSKDVRLDEQGFPVSKEINRIIDVIEKTPKNKFILNNSFRRLKFLNGLSHKQRLEFFEKNPKAMFSYGRGGVRSSVFTNFGFSDDGEKIYYDIIRLVPFAEPPTEYGEDELVKVDKVVRNSGLNVGNLNLSNWYHIDFINPTSSFLNWSNFRWEDLK